MRKRIKGWMCLIFSVLLTVSSAFGVFAAEETEQEQPEVTRLQISTAEEFLTFAEACRLDSYSQNLEVSLEADVDLGGKKFPGVPIFCGTFLGNGHKITGVNITTDGSVQGFFRYLTSTAQVSSLHLEGTVEIAGSRTGVGGLAGENAGRIENCSFSGTVTGGDSVGGLVGVNAVTGILDNSCALGQITGDHFVGGICGENSGVIRNCTNNAKVNTTATQNQVNITDITLDTLMGTETVSTVTDIGGIAGYSSGVIRDSSNRGDVGYQQMGYNIGGIAGSQMGYITGCKNYGQIHGRKEVGGIVGQMEPATKIEYSIDTLQILREQMDTLSALTGRATGNAQSNAAAVTGQIAVLEDHMESAKDAVGSLLPSEENPTLPDADTVLAAQNTLSSAMNGMNSTMNSIASSLQGTVSQLSRDMQAVSNQIGAMGETLNGAEENLGGTFADVSDADTAEETSGKVELCVNYGAVLADLNAGGIVGAMAPENDLDVEEDLEIVGDSSLNFTGQLRCVVLGCENQAAVNANKQNCGGIVGWQSMGLVKDAVNTGTLEAENADYVGGITGQSAGYIRSCSARCELAGGTLVGGIAGSGTVVTDCRSVILLRTGKEKLGGILGLAEENHTDVEVPIANNFYMSMEADVGGIDGISYAGIAAPMAQDDFMGLEALPEYFKSVSVTFTQEDGTVQTFELEPGSAFDTAQIPELPEKEGYAASWEGLDKADLSNVSFDLAFTAVYKPLITTLQSYKLRPNGMPVLLVQGTFLAKTDVDLKPLEDANAIEAWEFALPNEGSAEYLRFALPDGYAAEDVILRVCSGITGNYTTREFTANGSYIVFAVAEGDTAFCITEAPKDYSVWYWTGGGVLLLAALIVTAVLMKKKKGKKQKV